MSIFRYLTYTGLLIALLGCASHAPVQPLDLKSLPPARVFLDQNNRLNYRGILSAAANEKLFALYSHADPKPTVLAISSGGGNTNLGMDVGEWIAANKLDVVIERYCASSCANYIFTAGNNKYLYRDSIVLWHGSSLRMSPSENFLVHNNRMDDGQLREKRFFQRINVNPEICSHGFYLYSDRVTLADLGLDLSFWRRLKIWLFRSPVRVGGFDYSIDDLQKFGVKNIELIDGEWDWRAYNDSTYVFRAKYPMPVADE